MSSFYCEHCGKANIDTPKGYITGCEHYKPCVQTCDFCKGAGIKNDGDEYWECDVCDGYGFIDLNTSWVKDLAKQMEEYKCKKKIKKTK